MNAGRDFFGLTNKYPKKIRTFKATKHDEIITMVSQLIQSLSHRQSILFRMKSIITDLLWKSGTSFVDN